MLITPSFKKSLIVEQFQGNYLKAFKRKQLLGAPDLILRLLSAQGTLAILAGKKVLPHSHHSIISPFNTEMLLDSKFYQLSS